MKKGTKIALGIISVTVALCMGVSLAACSSNEVDEPEEPAAEHTEHTWDDGVVTTPATCGTDGVMTYTCTVCGETKTEKIAATGNHTFGTYAEYVTSDEAWYTACSVCGATSEEITENLTSYTLIADSEAALNAALAVAKDANTVEDTEDEAEATADDDSEDESGAAAETEAVVTKIYVKGTVVLSDVLYVDASNVEIYGDGQDASVIQLAAKETGTGAIHDCGIQMSYKNNDQNVIENVTFKDLTIDGSKLLNLGYDNAYIHAVEIYGGQNITFSGCKITNTNDYDLFGDSAFLIVGVSSSTPNVVTIDDCTIEGEEQALLLSDSNEDVITITDSTLVGKFALGASTYSPITLKFDDCKLYGTIRTLASSTTDISFTDCYITTSDVHLEGQDSDHPANDDSVKSLQLNSDVTFTGCTFEDIKIDCPTSGTGHTYTLINCKNGTTDLTAETIADMINADSWTEGSEVTIAFVFSTEEGAESTQYPATSDSTDGDEGNDEEETEQY